MSCRTSPAPMPTREHSNEPSSKRARVGSRSESRHVYRVADGASPESDMEHSMDSDGQREATQSVETMDPSQQLLFEMVEDNRKHLHELDVAQSEDDLDPSRMSKPLSRTAIKLRYRQKLLLRGHTRGVAMIRFSPDGQWIASCCQSRAVLCISLSSSEALLMRFNATQPQTRPSRSGTAQVGNSHKPCEDTWRAFQR